MHEFHYKKGELFCESLKISDIANVVETPFYLYSYKTITDHYNKIRKAFGSLRPLICYSMKANSNLSIVKILVNEGAGLDIVSGGELYKALKVGVDPKKIVYASVGKTAKEIHQAITAGILMFNVESHSELHTINYVARKLRKKVNVAIRINPDVDAATHHYITTAKKENKFGIDLDVARDIFARRSSFGSVRIVGLHIHIGSQISQGKPFITAIKKLRDFIAELASLGIRLEYFNIGGGLGIIYKNEKPMTAEVFARAVVPLLKKTGLKIILEPGRFIVGNAGILVTKIQYIKSSQRKRFVIVDAAMNDLMRPALYDAYHDIIPLSDGNRKGSMSKADIVGPVCESGDFFAKNRLFPELYEGECLAVMGAGAYGYSMASNYNARVRPAEILVKKNTFYVIRKREQYADLIRGEEFPRILR
ncbi:diaminopimelate decarboxylase [Candidatus Omnitrophota bacterium]